MTTEKGYKKSVHNFYERQRRVRSWPYFMLIGYIGLLTVFLAFKFAEHKPFVIGTFNYWAEFASVVMAACFYLYHYHLIGLTTAINDQGVFVKWTPFNKKFTMMLWEDIREIRLVEYKGRTSSKEYIQRFGLGTPFGIEIVSRSGRKKFISTRKIESLPRILARLAPEKFRSTGVGEQVDFKDD